MTNESQSAFATLSSLKKHIVEHVVRDRISTNEFIEKRFFANRHPSIVTRATSQLAEQGWLSSFPLLYPTKYFVAGKRAAAAYGLPVGRTQPLGPQSLPTEYAILEYTAANASVVKRLTGSELQSQVPWYGSECMTAPHCQRHSSDGLLLELIRVDLGGSADHVARKCRGDVEARLMHREFLELLSSGGFSIVVVTGSIAKADAILTALEQHVWPVGIVFRTAVFVTLIPLLPRSL